MLAKKEERISRAQKKQASGIKKSTTLPDWIMRAIYLLSVFAPVSLSFFFLFFLAQRLLYLTAASMSAITAFSLCPISPSSFFLFLSFSRQVVIKRM